MPSATLPGRPGTLTAEQEARLQDMWLATLNVFGVSTHDGPETRSSADGARTPNGIHTPPMQSAQRPRTNTVGSNKRNKRRISLFGRKQRADAHDEEDAGSEGGDATHRTDDLSTPEVDDKYGQSKDFAHALASQSPENLRHAFWSMVKHDHPDGLLLRFLRARKWDVQKALVMLISTMHWRMEEMHVDDDIIRNGEGGAVKGANSADTVIKEEAYDFMAQLRMGKSFLHGTDKEGRPMCFVRVRLHRQGEQSEASLEKYTVYVIETARMLLAPPVDTAAVIFDMSHFSMANMDYGPVRFMIKCFEANYPESLGVVLVHKSPWVFHGIWNIIKGWLDPIVAGKVHFTKNVEELEHFVSRSHILKELGGDDDWTYEYMEPKSGENHRMSDDATKTRLLSERESTVQDFEKATLAWLSSNKTMEDRKSLQERRETIAAYLRDGYWQLDPYIRARTVYDRTGIIKEGGRLDFYGMSTHIAKAEADSTYLSGTSRPEPRADDVD
ncbi:MAG: hypothetical protein M1830_003116 [Pleopsidium flavum]|nr:MAG: hypothetical protein M1830_003116 [Pleopsidium flavum]